jgi:hypothetical protein
MNDQVSSTIANERYALARRGLPLVGRVPTPMRAQWLPTAIKNPVSATQAAPVTQARDVAEDTNSTDDSWDMEISGLDAGDSEPVSSSDTVTAIDAADAGAPALAGAAQVAAIPGNRPIQHGRSASQAYVSEHPPLSADGGKDIGPQDAFKEHDGGIGATADRAFADVIDGSQAVSFANNAAYQHSTSINGVRRKGRVTASESIDAASAETLVQQFSAADDGISGHAAVSSSDAASRPQTTTPVDDATAVLAPEFSTSGQSLRSNRSNSNDSIRPAKTELSDRNHGGSSTDKGGHAGDSLQAVNPQTARPRAHTVEMGLPIETLSNRDRATATFRPQASPPAIDAARIASLLAPIASAAGPSVTIDRVHVTVQAPPSTKSAPNPMPSPMPSPQSSAAPRAYPSVSNYRSPWASYFTRRD